MPEPRHWYCGWVWRSYWPRLLMDGYVPQVVLEAMSKLKRDGCNSWTYQERWYGSRAAALRAYNAARARVMDGDGRYGRGRANVLPNS